MKKESIYACKDEEAYYLKDEEMDFRTPFFRDIDRILYSLAFIRYQDKTQVFSFQKHDHVSRRMIHVLMVSKIARTIGRSLGLNEDLIEASSLAHDLGHVPFGHVGEKILNKISLEHNEGYFNHNIESVRVLMNIENYGKGLNITVQVLDAIMCHNGEVIKGLYEPVKKSKEEFLKEYENSYKDKECILKMKPMTLEGCVVRISDLIAYLGRDIDDAIRLKLIKREDIPLEITSVLGSTTKEIVNTCVTDIIKNSKDHNFIKLSENVFSSIKKLQQFNYKYIYNYSESSQKEDELEQMFRTLFAHYLKDLNTNNKDSLIISSYLSVMSPEYQKNTPERIVLDYLSGMTDDFFISEVKKIRGEK